MNLLSADPTQTLPYLITLAGKFCGRHTLLSYVSLGFYLLVPNLLSHMDSYSYLVAIRWLCY